MSDAVCPVCFRHCRLREGQVGFCRARKNEGGRSISLNYAKVTSVALDPIEKKPLARFCPGSMILSVGSFGCNMDCPFCQNESSSCADEQSIEWRVLPPDELAELSPIEVTLPAEGRAEGDVVPVRLQTSVTAIGTLLLEAVPTDPVQDDERFKVELSVRGEPAWA